MPNHSQEKNWKILHEIAYAVNGDDNEFSLVKMAKQTNGRLKAQERWRARLTGAVTVLSALILPLIYFVIKNWNMMK